LTVDSLIKQQHNYICTMKLRLQNNSLRLRLDQDDVDLFKKEKRISETINFRKESNSLSYSINWERYAEKVSAEFVGNDILISVPDEVANKWIQDEEVGFEYNQDLGNGKQLSILVEKDFKCLNERKGENESRAFKNPLENSESC